MWLYLEINVLPDNKDICDEIKKIMHSQLHHDFNLRVHKVADNPNDYGL